MGHMTSGLGGLAPFFRRFLPLLNGYTPFFQPYFGHFWPPVNGFLPSPSGWDCSDFTIGIGRKFTAYRKDGLKWMVTQFTKLRANNFGRKHAK